MIQRQIKKQGYVLMDGAMGTYYYEKTAGEGGMAELANLTNPSLIEDIHREYIEAGANLIRTNTFCASRQLLGVDKAKQAQILKAGYQIAKKAVGQGDVQVYCSIGPLPEEGEDEAILLEEYKEILDSFMSVGATGFIFETWGQVAYLDEITSYIKEKNSEAHIIAQFALDATGHTRQGLSAVKIHQKLEGIKSIDLWGLNCGVGPMHMSKIIKDLATKGITVSTALPNAGYPYVENERTIYPGNPRYFAEVMKGIKEQGVYMVGGCCGTTPEHIRAMKTALHGVVVKQEKIKRPSEVQPKQKVKEGSAILEKLQKGEKVIMVELDPPYSPEVGKIMAGAKCLKECGADLITIADSPLGRPRADATMIGAKIIREVGIDVMPHVCCRDKNVIGLKSKILGLHMEGMRHLLAVTGDPVPSANRGEIKGVFNINSIKLVEMIGEMNQELFEEDPILCGSALNLNAKNIDALYKRTLRKQESGTEFFLTQPIYDDESIEKLRILKERHPFKIIAGIMPLVSLRNAMYLNNEVPGIDIPDSYINLFHSEMSREEAEDVGVGMAVDLAKKLDGLADGYYFMTPFNRATMIKKIIELL